METTRRNWVFGTVLVLLGAGLWFAISPVLPDGSRKRNAQVTQDALTLSQGLRRDLPLDEDAQDAFDAAWEKRRVLYDAELLAELRARLNTFLDFQVAEYGAAKECYVSGRVPERPPTATLVAEAALKDALGPQADEMIRQYTEKLREAAYKASPQVAGGVDPDLPKYDEMYDDLVKRWLPEARAKVEKLTAPGR